MPAPTETPAERAQRLVQTLYDNMYVNIRTTFQSFKFHVPILPMFTSGLQNKCKDEATTMVDDFLLSLTEFGLGSSATYTYWQNVRTEIQNLPS